MDNRGQTILNRAVQLVRALTGRGRRQPDDPWRAYARQARLLGLSGPALFLSFDCDTDLDIAAADKLGDFLTGLGIKATFAVPGAQLDRGRETYAALARAGFEFMNHGLLPHADHDGRSYFGITFYDQMPLDQVEADMRGADALIREVIGAPAAGFRAPHFGSFQQPEQVAFMHRLCKSMGYAYASTTLPRYALENGPAFLAEDMVELPVLGSWRHPHTILDSWNYLEDRINYRLSEDYFVLFQETLAQAGRHGVPLLLTWYADPCHVLDQPPFIEAMRLAARMGIPSYSGSQCAAMMRQALEGRA